MLHCPLLVLLLTCLGELPHPGEVVHVAVAEQRVGGQVELGRDLDGGVGGQGGQVDRHQLVPLQPETQQICLLSLALSQANKTFQASFRFTLHPCICVATMIIIIMQQPRRN